MRQPGELATSGREPGPSRGLRYDYRDFVSDRTNPALDQCPRCPSPCRTGRTAGALKGSDDDKPRDRYAKAEDARMNETVVLTPERILEVTEDVLRRFGLAKATVVDVARALDVSHGSVYRHFPSKASLREAVAKRWLERVS